MRLEGKTVFITGGSRGIGEAVALAFARAGAHLALVARSPADLERVAVAGRELGVQVLAVSADVARRADVERAAALALEVFDRIDVLVNAAGIYGPIGPLAQCDMNGWAAAIETNLLGTAFTMRAVLPGMIARRAGCVINFSGGGAVSPFPRFSAYSASKAAVVRLTETVAEEVKEYGVRVNAIAPGAVRHAERGKSDVRRQGPSGAAIAAVAARGAAAPLLPLAGSGSTTGKGHVVQSRSLD